MTYEEVVEFLFAQLPMYQRIGTSAFKKDLSNIRLLCEALGNPHDGFYDHIHIAGTNGKGSTSHMLSSIYQSAGYKVGLYTSPHYKDFRERIKINGQNISRKQVVDFVVSNQAVIEKIRPSFFEMSVAMAFDTFKKNQIDIAIIETGLGGRLDSTNIIQPLCSVITNIGFDHQNMLGETLKEIANEKAGIIKKETPVVIGEHQLPTDDVFRTKAKEYEAPLFFAQDVFGMKVSETSIDHLQLQFTNPDKSVLFDCNLPSGVEYNSRNALTAIVAVNIVAQHSNYQISQKDIIKGLEHFDTNSNYIGRWQIKSRNPFVILDAAHNEDGIKEVFGRVNLSGFQEVHVVFGSVKDKPLDSIFLHLPKEFKYYFAKPKVPRGLDTETLSQFAKKYKLRHRSYVSCKNAMKAAKRSAGKKDLILVTGSTFVVAELI